MHFYLSSPAIKARRIAEPRKENVDPPDFLADLYFAHENRDSLVIIIILILTHENVLE